MLFVVFLFFFFFKQKTAYEMRISDWSSDVCSSDLEQPSAKNGLRRGEDLMQLAHLKFTVGTVALAIAAASSVAHAQGATSSSSDSAAEAERLVPEIIVTAQKRKQSIQDVPISIQVVTGEALRANDLNDLQNLTQTLPAVTVADNGRSDENTSD